MAPTSVSVIGVCDLCMFGLRLCWGSDVRGINVLVRPANFFHVCPVSFRVTEIEEVLVSAVGAFNATRMLDRTPMLFRPGGNLGEIGEDAVDIGAIIAIQLLGKVEIAQAMAVEGKTGRTAESASGNDALLRIV